jgi:DNA-binding MarR family transcriptional regulator
MASPTPRRRPVPSADLTAALNGIRRLVTVLQSSARAIEVGTGITNAQLFLLQIVAERDGLSMGELAEAARAQQSTTSLIVGRLIRAGLVARRRSPHDRRRLCLSLTPGGRRLLLDAPTPPTARLIEALRSLPPVTLRRLATSLRALDTALGIRDVEAGMLFEGPTKRAGLVDTARVRRRR